MQVWMCRVLDKYYRVGIFQGGIPRILQLRGIIEDLSTGWYCAVLQEYCRQYWKRYSIVHGGSYYGSVERGESRGRGYIFNTSLLSLLLKKE